MPVRPEEMQQIYYLSKETCQASASPIAQDPSAPLSTGPAYTVFGYDVPFGLFRGTPAFSGTDCGITTTREVDLPLFTSSYLVTRNGSTTRYTNADSLAELNVCRVAREKGATSGAVVDCDAAPVLQTPGTCDDKASGACDTPPAAEPTQAPSL